MVYFGPNGAGKSTTMNMITGYIEQTSGSITINGFDTIKNAKKAKENIGYMPESTPLYSDMRVKEFVTYMAELKKIKKSNIKNEVNEILAKTGLSDVSNYLIRKLSRGYKQRVSLAGSLVGNPPILILDEPTVGLDPKQITEIRSLIKSLSKDHTIIISSHILSEISQLCEKVIIINKGEIIAEDSPQNLENKFNNNYSLLVTVEDSQNKMNKICDICDFIKECKFIEDKNDGTKQYLITPKENKDIRKLIFSSFANEDITIFELKKEEITLEDAFVKLVNSSNIKNDEKGGKK